MRWLIETSTLFPLRFRTFFTDRRRRHVSEALAVLFEAPMTKTVRLGLTHLARLYKIALFIVLFDDDLRTASV
ncbi:hypothetical protein D3C83_143320 [compost metagenome]